MQAKRKQSLSSVRITAWVEPFWCPSIEFSIDHTAHRRRKLTRIRRSNISADRYATTQKMATGTISICIPWHRLNGMSRRFQRRSKDFKDLCISQISITSKATDDELAAGMFSLDYPLAVFVDCKLWCLV
ncbi:hypothetical protein Ae201684P_006902 [Aphanomyces euteiches]|uniref:Uncharacterized protein n=1 Tax=Aphanomyces euteiches TaxID=100861 RepID=A0A6G0WBL6_9STRA|nr:hypothetical protein Ae201684_017226 [Aphanomyces euteiches]KAH9100708.1 hypothetical protein Ae201684P_006902 [Aphanomyces euteiches]